MNNSVTSRSTKHKPRPTPGYLKGVRYRVTSLLDGKSKIYSGIDAMHIHRKTQDSF